MHRTQDCKDASVATVCGRGADRRRAARGPGRRGPDEPAAGSSPGAITSDPIPPDAIAIAPISDEKLNAAAAAVGVATLQQSYESKIAAAPPSDKQRLAKERKDALEKAVTDQGLSVDEYNSIIRTAQNDPTFREKLTQRIPNSSH
jgi:Domain of unknown function (DUF4168)